MLHTAEAQIVSDVRAYVPFLCRSRCARLPCVNWSVEGMYKNISETERDKEKYNMVISNYNE